MKNTTLALFGILALSAGCKAGGDSDSGTTDTEDTSVEDPCAGIDPYTEGAIWDATGVSITVECYTGSTVKFGMAETIDMDNGWFGEDCAGGMAGYDLCHDFSGSSGGSLVSMYQEIAVDKTKTIDDLVAGESTLFEKSFDDGNRLTYYLETDDGCVTWGHDTSYYNGCTAI